MSAHLDERFVKQLQEEAEQEHAILRYKLRDCWNNDCCDLPACYGVDA